MAGLMSKLCARRTSASAVWSAGEWSNGFTSSIIEHCIAPAPGSQPHSETHYDSKPPILCVAFHTTAPGSTARHLLAIKIRSRGSASHCSSREKERGSAQMRARAAPVTALRSTARQLTTFVCPHPAFVRALNPEKRGWTRDPLCVHQINSKVKRCVRLEL